MMLVFGIYESPDVKMHTIRDDGSETIRNLSFVDVWFKNKNHQWVTLPLELIIRKDLKNVINDDDYDHIKEMFVSEQSFIRMGAEREAIEKGLRNERDAKLKEFMRMEIMRKSDLRAIEMEKLHSKENGLQKAI